MIPVTIDLVEQGLSRVLSQFNDSPLFLGLVKSYLESVQSTEDGIFQLLDQRSVYTAFGTTLDYIGAIVGEQRLGKSDSAYRDAILFRIFLNSSEGTPDQLLQILQTASGGTNVRLWEHFPVSCIFYTNGDITEGILDAMQDASPATSGNVGIIHDPDNNGYTPPELLPYTRPLS